MSIVPLNKGSYGSTIMAKPIIIRFIKKKGGKAAVFCCLVCSSKWEEKASCIKRGRSYCSSKCYHIARKGCKNLKNSGARLEIRLAKHPRWKGGRLINADGYVMVRFPPSTLCPKGGYRLEHRLVMEKELGRALKSTEIVHHKNGVKTDNRVSNLEITNRSRHTREHITERYAKGWKPR